MRQSGLTLAPEQSDRDYLTDETLPARPADRERRPASQTPRPPTRTPRPAIQTARPATRTPRPATRSPRPANRSPRTASATQTPPSATRGDTTYLVTVRKFAPVPYSLAHPAVIVNGWIGQNGFVTCAIFACGLTTLGVSPFWGGAICYRGDMKDRVLANGLGSRFDSYQVVRELWDSAERQRPSRNRS